MMILPRTSKIFIKKYILEKTPLLIFSFVLISVTLLVTERYLAKATADISTLLMFVYYIASKSYKKTWNGYAESFALITLFIFLLGLIPSYFQQHEINSQFGPKLESYSRMLIPIMLVPLLINTQKMKNINISLFAYLMLSTSILILITMSFDIYNHSPRGHRLHGHPIDYGNLCIMTGLLLLILMNYFSNYRHKIIFFLLAIISIGASLYSQTRGGWITLFSVPILWVYASQLKYKKTIILSIWTLSTISFFCIFILFPQRFLSLFYELEALWTSMSINKSGSLHDRLMLWRVSLQAFVENPFGGIGIGEFFAYKKEFLIANPDMHYIERYKHEHSDYMTILARMGITGIIAYAYMFYFLIKKFKTQLLQSKDKEAKTLSLLGLSIIICYFDFGLTESFFHSSLGSYFFFVTITMLLFIMNNPTSHTFNEKTRLTK